LSKDNTHSKTEIRVQYDERETVEAVLQAISPDNMTVPEGQTLNARLEDNTLIIEIECERGLGSLIATLDDLLSCIQSADIALKQVE
jgi:hypothetical protein